MTPSSPRVHELGKVPRSLRVSLIDHSVILSPKFHKSRSSPLLVTSIGMAQDSDEEDNDAIYTSWRRSLSFRRSNNASSASLSKRHADKPICTNPAVDGAGETETEVDEPVSGLQLYSDPQSLHPSPAIFQHPGTSLSHLL